MPGLDADDGQTGFCNAAEQPLRQRAGLKPDPGQPLGQILAHAGAEIRAESAGEADHVARAEPEFAEEPGPAADTQAEVDVQQEPGKWGWKWLFNRAA
jgi:hypothetical protein